MDVTLYNKLILAQRDFSSIYPQINYNFDLNNIPRLGPHQLPSICLFTLKSTKKIINCIILSNNCQFLAMGFQSSEILVCSVNPNNKLYSIKSVKELRNIHNTISNQRLLIGHTAAIFALAFEPTKQIYLLSASQDCTVRLWHLSIWSCLVVYKMHFQPILDGKFSSKEYFRIFYFSYIRFDWSYICIMWCRWFDLSLDN